MGIFWMIMVLGALIFVHELGHFVFAKLFGVTVYKFSLGFGPALVSKRVGETDYMISALPLGGYVKMAGEDDGVLDGEKINPENLLNKKPAWQRAIIFSAGVAFNVLFAVMLFVGSNLFYGTPVLTAKVGRVVSGYPAEAADVQAGDVIIALSREFDTELYHVEGFMDVLDFLKENEGNNVTLWVTRGDKKLGITVKPELREIKNIFGETVKQHVIGIESAEPVMVRSAGLAFSNGIEKSFFFLKLMVVWLWKLVTGSVSAKDSLGGPIMIVGVGSQAASRGFMYLMDFAAKISLNLALMNILPIPVLDGGHLLFLGIEKVRGRPLSKKTKGVISGICMFLLLLLLVFATVNDIFRFILKG